MVLDEQEIDFDIEVEDELRLTELEMAKLDLTDRDYQISRQRIEICDAKLANLALDYDRKKKQLRQERTEAERKSEQTAIIRNTVLSEVEHRLRKIDKDFSFREYLQQDDGTFIREKEVVPELEEESSSKLLEV